MAMRKHKYSFLLQTVQATVRLSLWSTRLWISVALWMPIGAIALGQSNLSESERKVEEVWRSSEEPGEVSTSKRKRRMKYRLPEPPPGALYAWTALGPTPGESGRAAVMAECVIGCIASKTAIRCIYSQSIT
jgi:hypothetical protein